MDTDEQENLTGEAERAATYWKGLVRSGVPEAHATSLTSAWILGWIRAYTTDEPPPPEEPWRIGPHLQ